MVLYYSSPMTSPFPTYSTAIFAGHEVNSMLRLEGTVGPACPRPASQDLPQASPESQHLHFILPWGHQSLAQLHDGCVCVASAVSGPVCHTPTGSLSRRKLSLEQLDAGSAWGCPWTCPSLPNALSPCAMAPPGEGTAYPGVALHSFLREQPDPCSYLTCHLLQCPLRG